MSISSSLKWNHDFPRLVKQLGFRFISNKPKIVIDWNLINFLDINSIISEQNVKVLETHINDVIFYPLRNEEIQILDQKFLKIFQIAQLTIEYLLFCLHYLDNGIAQLEEHSESVQKENEDLNNTIKQKDKIILKLKKRLSEFIVSCTNSNLPFFCNNCQKIFVSQKYLDLHSFKKHSNNCGDNDNVLSEQDDNDLYLTKKLIQKVKNNMNISNKYKTNICQCENEIKKQTKPSVTYSDETVRLKNKIKDIKQQLNSTECIISHDLIGQRKLFENDSNEIFKKCFKNDDYYHHLQKLENDISFQKKYLDRNPNSLNNFENLLKTSSSKTYLNKIEFKDSEVQCDLSKSLQGFDKKHDLPTIKEELEKWKMEFLTELEKFKLKVYGDISDQLFKSSSFLIDQNNKSNGMLNLEETKRKCEDDLKFVNNSQIEDLKNNIERSLKDLLKVELSRSTDRLENIEKQIQKVCDCIEKNETVDEMQSNKQIKNEILNFSETHLKNKEISNNEEIKSLKVGSKIDDAQPNKQTKNKNLNKIKISNEHLKNNEILNKIENSEKLSNFKNNEKVKSGIFEVVTTRPFDQNNLEIAGGNSNNNNAINEELIKNKHPNNYDRKKNLVKNLVIKNAIHKINLKNNDFIVNENFELKQKSRNQLPNISNDVFANENNQLKLNNVDEDGPSNANVKELIIEDEQILKEIRKVISEVVNNLLVDFGVDKNINRISNEQLEKCLLKIFKNQKENLKDFPNYFNIRNDLINKVDVIVAEKIHENKISKSQINDSLMNKSKFRKIDNNCKRRQVTLKISSPNYKLNSTKENLNGVGAIKKFKNPRISETSELIKKSKEILRNFEKSPKNREILAKQEQFKDLEDKLEFLKISDTKMGLSPKNQPNFKNSLKIETKNGNSENSEKFLMQKSSSIFEKESSENMFIDVLQKTVTNVDKQILENKPVPIRRTILNSTKLFEASAQNVENVDINRSPKSDKINEFEKIVEKEEQCQFKFNESPKLKFSEFNNSKIENNNSKMFTLDTSSSEEFERPVKDTINVEINQSPKNLREHLGKDNYNSGSLKFKKSEKPVNPIENKVSKLNSNFTHRVSSKEISLIKSNLKPIVNPNLVKKHVLFNLDKKFGIDGNSHNPNMNADDESTSSISSSVLDRSK